MLCREALYGGAAGGGKSDALLMGALMFVEVPSYNAILFRKTYRDLALPEALMDRAIQWLGGSEARWSGENHTFTFPSTARLVFGYLDNPQDRYRYQSAEFQYIGFDETTQFSEVDYRYLHSRLRRLANSDVPLRVRCGSNPGNVGHDWVKRRFMIEGERYGRVFIPARLQDNPNLDQTEYVQSLNQLDPITRRQLLDGDWTAKHGGGLFQREWFEVVGEAPADAVRVRYWDMAATAPKPGKDPDWTVGAKMAFKKGIFYLEHIIRVRVTPDAVERLIRSTAMSDFALHGLSVSTWQEVEPGSEGVALLSHYQRNVVPGMTFRGDKVSGPKELRANPVSSAAEAGNLKLVQGTWINAFLDEAEGFPLGEHDDQIDAVSGAFAKVAGQEPWKPLAGRRPW